MRRDLTLRLTLTVTRQIGPIGRFSRIVGGSVAIALPIASSGFTVPGALVAFVGLPVVVTIATPLITTLFGRIWSTAQHSRHGICSALGCSLIALMALAGSGMSLIIGASGSVAFWVWLGASMLLAAARGYGGCEVLAAWNVITGREDQIGCIVYTPIDAAEARRSDRRSAARASG